MPTHLNQKDIDDCLRLTTEKDVKIAFKGCTIKNIIFKKEISKNISFSESYLENCSFIGLNLKEVKFTKATVRNVKMIHCKNFKVSDIIGTLEIKNDENTNQTNKRGKLGRQYRPRGPVRSLDERFGYDAVNEEKKPRNK